MFTEKFASMRLSSFGADEDPGELRNRGRMCGGLRKCRGLRKCSFCLLVSLFGYRSHLKFGQVMTICLFDGHGRGTAGIRSHYLWDSGRSCFNENLSIYRIYFVY